MISSLLLQRESKATELGGRLSAICAINSVGKASEVAGLGGCVMTPPRCSRRYGESIKKKKGGGGD